MTSNTITVLEQPAQDFLGPASCPSLVLDKTISGRNWKVKRFCYACGASTTRIRANNFASYFDWFLNRDAAGTILNMLCAKCADQYVRRPKRKAYFDIKNIETHRKFSPRRLNYKGRILNLKHNPRIGVCNWCRAVVPFDCRRTGLHHEVYDDSDPLKHTIELCNRCHNKTKQFAGPRSE